MTHHGSAWTVLGIFATGWIIAFAVIYGTMFALPHRIIVSRWWWLILPAVLLCGVGILTVTALIMVRVAA